MFICQDIPTIIAPKTLNEDCNSDFDCEQNLYGYKSCCSQSSTTSDYCSSSGTAVKTSSGYQCQEKDYIAYCIYSKFDTTVPFHWGRGVPPSDTVLSHYVTQWDPSRHHLGLIFIK